MIYALILYYYVYMCDLQYISLFWWFTCFHVLYIAAHIENKNICWYSLPLIVVRCWALVNLTVCLLQCIIICYTLKCIIKIQMQYDHIVLKLLCAFCGSYPGYLTYLVSKKVLKIHLCSKIANNNWQTKFLPFQSHR